MPAIFSGTIAPKNINAIGWPDLLIFFTFSAKIPRRFVDSLSKIRKMKKKHV
jgi:hypothetical protein